ncbi:MAG: alanine racemase [Mycolicibacterium cosmeticum]|nr:alanine racemase [Mycolicibacterium cosmeticum]
MVTLAQGEVALRPHAKSHKSSWIAAQQMTAGAVGVCCAKLGEAEALSATGVRGILLTSPVCDALSARRICDLAVVDEGFRCVIDHVGAAIPLATEAAARDLTIAVLIDVDVGLHRTGVRGVAEALVLTEHLGELSSLRLLGVQGYGGHWQHISNLAARRDAVGAGMDLLSSVVDALRQSGHHIAVVTGGGTGTAALDVQMGCLNEIQPGSYVFMDAQYLEALVEGTDLKASLWVSSQVISVNAEAIVTVDAGLKAFATDGPAPRPGGDRFGDSTYFYFGDEHGGLTRPAGSPVRLGERVELLIPHCDPTVDRHDAYHIVSGDRVTAIVSIDAARASR